MNSDRIFAIAVVLSIVIHGFLLAAKTDMFGGENIVTITKIALSLEEPPPPPPPPPKKEPEPIEEPVERPEDLHEDITEVTESAGGLRTAELTDAAVGKYEKGPAKKKEPEPEPKPVVKKKKVDEKAILAEYNKAVAEEIGKNKRYPAFAQRHNIEGVVRVTFIIEVDGTFSDIKITRSSGNRMLDDAAIQSVKSSSGKVKKPEEIARLRIQRSVVIRFELSNV